MARRIVLWCPGVLVGLALYFTLGTGGEPFSLPNLSPLDEQPTAAAVRDSGERLARIRIIAETTAEARPAIESLRLDESSTALRARVFTDSVLLDDSLELVIRSTGKHGIQVELKGHPTRPTNREPITVYDWQSVPPGTYELSVHARGVKRPLLTIPNLQVTAGLSTKDARLDRIDLRNRLRAFKIRVFGPWGERLGQVQAVHVMLDDPAPDAELAAFQPRHGVTTMFSDEAVIDVLVIARGYRPRQLSLVAGDNSVQLEALPRVILRAAQGLAALPADVALRLLVLATDRPSRDRRRFRAAHDHGTLNALLATDSRVQTVTEYGSARFTVRDKGSYRIHAFLTPKGSRHMWPLRGVEPAEIEVGNAEQPRAFDVSLSLEAIARALYEMDAGSSSAPPRAQTTHSAQKDI